MALVKPVVEVFFSLDGDGGDFFTVGDPVKGQLSGSFGLVTPVATDITDHCHSITISRGRSRELDEIQSGFLTVGLRNYDAIFLDDSLVADVGALTDDNGDDLTDDNGDPLTASVRQFSGDDLAPGKRVRITVEGVVIYDGTIDDWDYSYLSTGEVGAAFIAYDALGDLAAIDFNEWTTTAGQTAGERLSDVLNRPEVAYPAGRSIGPGISTLQSDQVSDGMSVLSYAQLVAKSDLGRLFADREGVLTFRDRHSVLTASPIVAFSDQDTEIPYEAVTVQHGSELLFTRVSVDRANGTRQTSENTAARTKYKTRALSLSGLLLDSDTQSATMADYLVSIYSDPTARISSITVALESLTPVQRVEVLRLDLGDVISVEWQPTGSESPATTRHVVEAVSHSTTESSTHTVTLGLSLLDTAAVFVVGDPEFGALNTGGVLAF